MDQKQINAALAAARPRLAAAEREAERAHREAEQARAASAAALTRFEADTASDKDGHRSAAHAARQDRLEAAAVAAIQAEERAGAARAELCRLRDLVAAPDRCRQLPAEMADLVARAEAEDRAAAALEVKADGFDAADAAHAAEAAKAEALAVAAAVDGGTLGTGDAVAAAESRARIARQAAVEARGRAVKARESSRRMRAEAARIAREDVPAALADLALLQIEADGGRFWDLAATIVLGGKGGFPFGPGDGLRVPEEALARARAELVAAGGKV